MSKEIKSSQWYKNRFFILAAITVAVFTIVGFTTFISQHGPVTVSGTLSLYDSGFGEENDLCYGSGGYSDISEGSQVTVSDGSDKIITVSSLESGNAKDSYECVFDFVIKDLPYSDVYQFEVSHRGKVVYSRQQLVEKNYTVEMTLGD